MITKSWSVRDAPEESLKRILEKNTKKSKQITKC